MLLPVAGINKPVAVVEFYGQPNKELYETSSKTYYTVQHLRDADVQVIDVNCIQSVVMMAPDQRYKLLYQDGSENDRWYLMEKPGVKLSHMMGTEEIMTEE
jgi:hypothetical protein